MTVSAVPYDLRKTASQLPHWARDVRLLNKLNNNRIEVGRLLKECLNSPEFVETILGGPGRILNVLHACRTQADWDNALDVLTSESDAGPQKQGRTIPFPPAPFPDTAALKAITSRRMLKREGRVMKHCCASSFEQVHREWSYFYHWSEEEEVTIELSRDDELWSISEMKTAGNEEPSASTRRKLTIAVMKALGDRFSVG